MYGKMLQPTKPRGQGTAITFLYMSITKQVDVFVLYICSAVEFF